jgi:hypothetical protein
MMCMITENDSQIEDWQKQYALFLKWLPAENRADWPFYKWFIEAVFLPEIEKDTREYFERMDQPLLNPWEDYSKLFDARHGLNIVV